MILGLKYLMKNNAGTHPFLFSVVKQQTLMLLYITNVRF